MLSLIAYPTRNWPQLVLQENFRDFCWCSLQFLKILVDYCESDIKLHILTPTIPIWKTLLIRDTCDGNEWKFSAVCNCQSNQQVSATSTSRKLWGLGGSAGSGWGSYDINSFQFFRLSSFSDLAVMLIPLTLTSQISTGQPSRSWSGVTAMSVKKSWSQG